MRNKISIAANQLKPKDLSRKCYTTLGFGNYQPIFMQEVVNKDKYKIRIDNFSRLAQMQLPNFSDINMKIHGFYVPFRLVWNHYENFKEGLPSWNSQGSQNYGNCPRVSDWFFTNLFINLSTPYSGASGSIEQLNNNYYLTEFWSIDSSVSSRSFDFSIEFDDYNSDSSHTVSVYHFAFTSYGKHLYTMIQSLGYAFQFPLTIFRVDSLDHRPFTNLSNLDYCNWPNIEVQDQPRISGLFTTSYGNYYSALPLMCMLKIYLDYFIPSQLQPSSNINQFFNYVHEIIDDNISYPLDIIESHFVNCVTDIIYFYQNNYFTSSWLSPNSPVPGLNNIGSSRLSTPITNDILTQGNPNSVAENVRDQPVVQTDNYVAPANTGNISQLTADGLTLMQKFARFIKRGNFAGSRSVERLLARFGVRVDDFQIGMCRYLGSDTIPMSNQEVVQTGGDTSDVGKYRAKGWFASDKPRVFSVNCDLAGFVIFMASLETPSTYIRGTRRHCLHMTPLDFYTPEFDGGLFQAISKIEILNGVGFPIHNNLTRIDDVYGFQPRYTEYKKALDMIGGDFLVPRASANTNLMILPRELVDVDALFYEYQNAAFDDIPTISDFAYDPYIRDNPSKVNPIQSLRGNDMYQFNRIFAETSGWTDPVFGVFNISCIVNSVSLPLSESSELIGRGKELEFESNGVHL